MTIPLQLVVVEDSDTDVELLARHFAKSGLEVAIHHVQTEAAFLAALEAVKPALILSDFSLPQFSGLRALELAVALAPETPFIYVSGTIGEERAIDALRRGATDYVLKTNLSRLSAAVERALRESALKTAERRSETQRREQEVRLQRLTRSYRMLSSTSSAILRLHSRKELLDEVCRIAAVQGGYERVTVSLTDPNSGLVLGNSCAGVNPESMRGRDYAILASGLESAMAEQAVQQGKPVLHNDLMGEQDSVVQHDLWITLGFCAVAALPLLIDGAAIGVIVLYSAHPEVFDEAEVAVLVEMTANVAFGLQYLEKDEAVHFLSHFDSSTGLAKRPLFCQRLAQKLAADGQPGGRTVVAFDVQKLGAINDSYGRYVGDRLIEAIAARLKHAYADNESVAYFGSGTFALTLSGAASGADAGRQYHSQVAELFVEPFFIDGQELRPAFRCGMALYPQDAESAETLIQNAEGALKGARGDGEPYMQYELVTQRPTSRSLALESRLGGALDREEFLLHYQPKINIESGRIEGFEALLRWQDGHDGLVPPSLFVPLLERSGAIVAVGEWVLRQAANDIRRWTADGLEPLRVAVNVSPLQLRRRDFVERVQMSLRAAMHKPAAVDIEITESMLMQDLELSVRKLQQLRDAGIGVAIDDFGTGYSSLGLLAKLPVDTLKIDRSFIENIVDTPNVMTLVSTIITLARAFNMRTVAEGVETREQLGSLKFLKCDQAQGYLFSRPVPADAVPALVAQLHGRTVCGASAANQA